MEYSIGITFKYQFPDIFFFFIPHRSLALPHTLSPRTAFGHVRATDADLGAAARLVYARDGGNGSSYFDVSRSGEVKTKLCFLYSSILFQRRFHTSV